MAVKLIGNLNQYGKLLKMQQQWSAKKSDPKLITSKADLNTSLIEAMKPKEQEYTQEEIQKKVEDMKSKLRSGGRLSPRKRNFWPKTPRRYTAMWSRWKKSGRPSPPGCAPVKPSRRPRA